MSVDDRLRNGLRQIAAPIVPDPGRVVDNVVASGRRHRLRRRVVGGSLALTLALVGSLIGAEALDFFDQTRGASSTPVTSAPTGPIASPGFLSQSAPVCVAANLSHREVCGLSPASRRIDGGIAYRVVTVGGLTAWVALPDVLVPEGGVVAVPQTILRVHGEPNPMAELTTSPAEQRVAQHCAEFPSCVPVATVDKLLENGIRLRAWEDASGTVDFLIVSIEMGGWTLEISNVDLAVGEAIARGLTWEVQNSYLTLTSSDPDIEIEARFSGFAVWLLADDPAQAFTIVQVIPDCHLSELDADLLDAGPGLETHPSGTVTGGRWCYGEDYWVDVSLADEAELQMFYEHLMVVPSLAEP